MCTIIVRLGDVESDDNDNIEEDNSSDVRNEKLMASHYSQEAPGERGRGVSVFGYTLQYMLRQTLSHPPLPLPFPSSVFPPPLPTT
jgi:hypothetical protein